MFNQITIIGVGLIGGSLALALKKANLCKHIVGYGRNKKNLEAAIELGVIDSYQTELNRAVAGSELLFLATPIGTFENLFTQLAAVIDDNIIITDGGSAKVCVIEAAQKAFNNLPKNLVPGHPIAGAEHSGVTAAYADLYQDHRVILTPTNNTNPEALTKVEAMWSAVGATVSTMTAEHHDQVLALTSHLPHALAFALVEGLAKQHDVEEIFTYAAGGFRDFTRIASGNPEMWRDICLHNSTAILEGITAYQADLARLKSAIAAKDSAQILEILSQAKHARDQHLIKK